MDYCKCMGYHETNIDYFIKQIKQNTSDIEYIKSLLPFTIPNVQSIYFVSEIGDLTTFVNTHNNYLLIFDDNKEHKVDNVIFENDVVLLFLDGTLGGNITINGTIISPIKKIFSNYDNLVVNNNKGYPEYFGAKPNDPLFYNQRLIEDCLKVFGNVHFRQADYYINDTIVIDNAHKVISGVKTNQEYTPSKNYGSRIVQVNNKSAIKIGNGTDTGIQSIYIDNLSIICDSNDKKTNGIIINGVRDLRLKNITVSNFNYGYNIGYCILSYITNCRYLNNTTDQSTKVAFNILDKAPSSLGISSIVSLYIDQCDIHFNSSMDTHFGIYFSGINPIADISIQNTNFFGCGKGIFLKTSSSSETQQNVLISNNTVDNTTDGITIDGKIKALISNNLISSGSWSELTKHCLYILNNTGVVAVDNMLKSGEDTTNDYGIRVVQSDLLRLENSLINFTNPLFITNSKNVKSKNMFENRKAITKYTCIYQNVSKLIEESVIKGNNSDSIQLLTCTDATIFTSGLVGSKVVIGSAPINSNDVMKVLDNNIVLVGAK